MYEDQVRLFVDYQTRVALRAIERNPGADLVMIYIEQPDGSGHQFLLVDPRQPTDPTNPTSIGTGQDPAKKARYWNYLRNAYRVANEAVHRIIQATGVDRHGAPRSNVIVVSDHGFAPFHTAVSMANFLAAKGFDPSQGPRDHLGARGEHLHQPEGQGAERRGRARRVPHAAARPGRGAARVRRHQSELRPRSQGPGVRPGGRTAGAGAPDRPAPRRGHEPRDRPGLRRRLRDARPRLQLRRRADPRGAAPGRSHRQRHRSFRCRTSTAPTATTRGCAR